MLDFLWYIFISNDTRFLSIYMSSTWFEQWHIGYCISERRMIDIWSEFDSLETYLTTNREIIGDIPAVTVSSSERQIQPATEQELANGFVIFILRKWLMCDLYKPVPARFICQCAREAVNLLYIINWVSEIREFSKWYSSVSLECISDLISPYFNYHIYCFSVEIK